MLEKLSSMSSDNKTFNDIELAPKWKDWKALMSNMSPEAQSIICKGAATKIALKSITNYDILVDNSELCPAPTNK